jgi:hypothetical protein
MRDIRRTIVVAALAGCGGFCLASATALGGVKLNIWRDYGDKFQLGYVIGYLDAANLAKHHDIRAFPPTGGKPNYELWRSRVNEFYADPAHAEAQLPDAMAAVGKKFQADIMKAWENSMLQTPLPSASPAAAAERAVAAPTDAPGASHTPHAPAAP